MQPSPGVTLLLLPMALAQSLPELEDRALSESPDLAALQARREALVALEAASGLWPDPVASVEVSNWPASGQAHPMSGVQLRVQQPLPDPGARPLQRELAGLQVEATDLVSEQAALALREEVARSWTQLTLLRGLQAVVAEQEALTRSEWTAQSERLAADRASTRGLLRLEWMALALHEQGEELAAREAELLAGLESALGWTAIQTPDAWTPKRPEHAADWLDTATTANPWLRGLALQSESSALASELAQVSGRPNVAVWAGYRVRTLESDPTDLISVGVSAPLSRTARREAEAQSAYQAGRAQQSRSLWEQARRDVEADLAASEARWTRALERLETLDEERLPLGRALLEATLEDFALDQADVDDVTRAQLDLLALEQERLDALAATWGEWARVRTLIGGGTP